MKDIYIKPSILVIDTESETLLAGSGVHEQTGLNTGGTTVIINNGSADGQTSGGQSSDGTGSRAKGGIFGWD